MNGIPYTSLHNQIRYMQGGVDISRALHDQDLLSKKNDIMMNAVSSRHWRWMLILISIGVVQSVAYAN